MTGSGPSGVTGVRSVGACNLRDVGRLIVVEGIDGAGKNTLVAAVADVLTQRGLTVARTAFPRYDDDIHAALVRDALHGDMGDLSESVHAMAVLFALDRRAAAAGLREQRANHDVVLVDRYVASNAAYAAARLHQDADGEVVEWIRRLEVYRFDIPLPDVQVLLDVPADVAAQRAQSRERQDADRRRDRYESDADLQQRCVEAYRRLAANRWLSPWIVVDGSDRPSADKVAAELA